VLPPRRSRLEAARLRRRPLPNRGCGFFSDRRAPREPGRRAGDLGLSRAQRPPPSVGLGLP